MSDPTSIECDYYTRTKHCACWDDDLTCCHCDKSKESVHQAFIKKFFGIDPSQENKQVSDPTSVKRDRGTYSFPWLEKKIDEINKSNTKPKEESIKKEEPKPEEKEIDRFSLLEFD